MKLADLDVVSRNQLATQYRNEGMAVLRAIELPDCFEPQVTDFVLLHVDGTCEVYMGSNVAYSGRARAWRQILGQGAGPGGTLQVLSTRGDFFTGLNKTIKLLGEAGGEYQDAGENQVPEEQAASPQAGQVFEPLPMPQEVDRPLPEDAPRHQNRVLAARRGRGHDRTLRDLVEEWRRNPRELAGREEILDTLKTNLIRESKPGVVMIGKPGVGKSCIVELLARDIATNRLLPPALSNTPVYDLPLGSLVENARYVGDIERQARRILESADKPIFFADEIHQLARTELHALCDLLKPALAAGQVRILGATTPVEWRKVEDRAFKRRFLEMTIEEPSPSDASIMARERAKALARHHHVDLPESLVREAVMLAARYLPMQQFPDKAVDILDLAAALQVSSGVTGMTPDTARRPSGLGGHAALAEGPSSMANNQPVTERS